MSYELIKREPILEFLSQNTSGNDWLLNQYNADWIYCLVASQPTIDAVPVCRCRECMYWQSGENECEKWEYCTFHNIGIGPHSFCSYGERKDGEG